MSTQGKYSWDGVYIAPAKVSSASDFQKFNQVPGSDRLFEVGPLKWRLSDSFLDHTGIRHSEVASGQLSEISEIRDESDNKLSFRILEKSIVVNSQSTGDRFNASLFI